MPVKTNKWSGEKRKVTGIPGEEFLKKRERKI
jgi:hypothetical protein